MRFKRFQQWYEIHNNLCDSSVRPTLNFVENIIHDDHIAHIQAFFKTVQWWLFSHTCSLTASRISALPNQIFQVCGNKYVVIPNIGFLGFLQQYYLLGTKRKIPCTKLSGKTVLKALPRTVTFSSWLLLPKVFYLLAFLGCNIYVVTAFPCNLDLFSLFSGHLLQFVLYLCEFFSFMYLFMSMLRNSMI